MAKIVSGEHRHRGKALRGKGELKPTAFDPGAAVLTAAPATEAPRRARPSPTRYPIAEAAFRELEQHASTAKDPIKKDTTTVKDAGKGEELATAAFARPGLAVGLMAPVPSAPAAIGNFAGLTDTNWFPPDCTMAAGPQHIMLSVNSTVAVYSKTGTVVLGPTTLNAWFANVIAGATIFDPKLLFDQHSNRWLFLAVALPARGNKSYFLLSVSKTADPTQGWWNHQLDATKDGTTATANWADYPCLGVDSEAVYVTANMFKFNGGFADAKVRVLNKAQLLSGATPTFFDFTKLKNLDAGGTLAFTIQPCHTYGAPQVEYLVNSLFTASATEKHLTLWSLTNPNRAAPTLTRKMVATDPYGQPPPADQKGGGAALNAGDVRLLNAVFRGGSVWTTLSTLQNWNETVNRAAVHWFQINPTSAALIQQGVYGAKAVHYFYPAVMPDSNGNMTLVFCRSGSKEFASIRYTGRKASDPVGQLQGSAVLKKGTGNSQRPDRFGRNRWGDYAGISVDPADPRLVWVYSMFADAGNQWGTWVGSSRF